MKRAVAALFLVSSTVLAAEGLKLGTPTSSERSELIHRARVWEPTDVKSKDLYNGPKGKLSVAVGGELVCEFVPEPLGGFTEKFLCRLDDGTVVKVKYIEDERFKEVYGEVLGTRLFWALGFYADKMLPVRVVCRNCPEWPWRYVNIRKSGPGRIRSFPLEARIGTYVFDPATIEERLDVETIEQREDQGWSWKSLALVDAAAGGATTAELDALKLLNAFVQNADNGHAQNALACPRDELVKEASGHVTCRRPILYVDDLGAVFGKGGNLTRYEGRVDYEGWKAREVWKNPTTCQARLAAIGWLVHPTCLVDPIVGEEGRALLARLLGELSDSQIADLFRAARLDTLHQKKRDGREVSVEDWVSLFKHKRDEITNHPGCGAPP